MDMKLVGKEESGRMLGVGLGDRVLLKGTHPWKGYTGTVVRLTEFQGKPSVVVQIKSPDCPCDKHEVGVTRELDLKKL